MVTRRVADNRATSRHRNRVRARGEAGAGQVSRYTYTADGTRLNPNLSPTLPSAPTASTPITMGIPTIDTGLYTDPRMGYTGAGYESMGSAANYGLPTPSPSDVDMRFQGQRYQDSVETYGSTPKPWAIEKDTRDSFYQDTKDRLEDSASMAASAAGITAALQAQADALRAQRESALTRGLAATAAKYDDQLKEIDKRISQINTDAKNNNDIAGWLTGQMAKPFEIAQRAAQAIDTAAATAATEAAVANITQAKLESDARLQTALSEIGFEGLVGQIGIEAAQNMVAENSFLTEQVDTITAGMEHRQALADFERDLFIANANQNEAGFNRETESGRLITSVQLREALADATAQREKVEMAKVQALNDVRQEIGRQYGEGVTLPSEQDFMMMAVQSQWDMIAGDLPDEEMGLYLSMMQDIQSMDVDLQNEQAVRQFLMTYNEQAVANGEDPIEFDNDDIVILRQLDAIMSGAQEEYNRIKEFQGSQAQGENRDPANLAEVERWRETREVTGPYSQRAEQVMSFANDIRQRFGIKVDGDDFMRPLEWGGKNGRAVNSDHNTAGALDLYFEPGSQNTELYKTVEAYVNTLRGQGVVSSVVWMGDNAAHHNHIHISFALPYGGQADFVDTSAGANVAADSTLEEQIAEAPGYYSTPSGAGRTAN